MKFEEEGHHSEQIIGYAQQYYTIARITIKKAGTNVRKSSGFSITGRFSFIHSSGNILLETANCKQRIYRLLKKIQESETIAVHFSRVGIV